MIPSWKSKPHTLTLRTPGRDLGVFRSCHPSLFTGKRYCDPAPVIAQCLSAQSQGYDCPRWSGCYLWIFRRGWKPHWNAVCGWCEPGKRRRKLLLNYAIAHFGANEVDVNEQNPQGVAFYQHMGFVQVGRSERDGQGNAFPLLHMRLGEWMLT